MNYYEIDLKALIWIKFIGYFFPTITKLISNHELRIYFISFMVRGKKEGRFLIIISYWTIKSNVNWNNGIGNTLN